jgi:parallel beta-helix repeat protein
VFTFTGITYTVAANNLSVYRNGQRLDVGVDFTETSSSSITLTFDPNDADKFVFITNEATTTEVGNTFAITHTESGTDYNLATYLQNRYVVNPLDEGATGSGDDTVGVVTAFSKGAGKAIFIPAGYTFACDSGLVVDTDNTIIFGGGKIIARDSADKLLKVTGSNCVIDGVQLEGDGTATQSKSVANTDRVALVYITGNNNTVRNCSLTLGHQNFIHAHTADNVSIHDNKLYDGVLTETDTAYQGIRITDCDNADVTANKFIAVSNRSTVQAIFAGDFGTGVDRLNISGNTIENAHDHGIYVIAATNSTITNNIVRSDSSAIVNTGYNSTLADVEGSVITGNTCRVGTAKTATTPAIYLRDINNTICSNNTTHDFPRGIQGGPVQYDSASNTYDNNTITNNNIYGFTSEGIVFGKAGLNLGSMSKNDISHNMLVAGSGATAGISAVVGQQASSDIFIGNKIAHNTIINVDNNGIVLDNNTDTEVSNNKITDDRGVPVMPYGIDGSNTCTSCYFLNNTVKGSTSTAIRRTQQASHTNTHRGNKTGTDGLTGTVTLTNSTTTVIPNDNINGGSGYTSRVLISPINTSAATLIGSAKSPTIGSGDYINNTSFTIRTADGTAAVGTEQYFYEIVQ